MNYEGKYLKYKKKYLDLKSQIGGGKDFMDAVRAGNRDLVEAKLKFGNGRLLSKKANPNQIDQETGKLPVDVAIDRGDFAMASLIKNYGGHGREVNYNPDYSITIDGNNPLSQRTISPNIKAIYLKNFNQPLGDSLKNFKLLEIISFGADFNQPLNKSLHGLKNLREVYFTDNDYNKHEYDKNNNKSNFNQSLFFSDPQKSVFPDEYKTDFIKENLNTVFYGLDKLNLINFGDSFDHRIYGLKELDVINHFVSTRIEKFSVNAFHFNKHLRTVIFGNSFNQPYNSFLNSPIQTLVFGNSFNNNFFNTNYNPLSENLKYLYLGTAYRINNKEDMSNFLTKSITPNLEFIFVSRREAKILNIIIEQIHFTKKNNVTVKAIEDMT